MPNQQREAATANIAVMRKAEVMTTAGEHFLNPKKHWTIPKLKDINCVFCVSEKKGQTCVPL